MYVFNVYKNDMGFTKCKNHISAFDNRHIQDGKKINK